MLLRHEQFLLFPQCFQKACFPGASKGVIVWEWVKCHDVTKNQFNLIIDRLMTDWSIEMGKIGIVLEGAV